MANLPLNHECSICEKRYYWCNTCARVKNLTPWKVDVCSEECHAVLEAYIKYVHNEIGEEELREILLANGFKGKKVYKPLQELFDRLTADPEPEVEIAPAEPELQYPEETGKWEEDVGFEEKPATADTGYFCKLNRKNKSSK